MFPMYYQYLLYSFRKNACRANRRTNRDKSKEKDEANELLFFSDDMFIKTLAERVEHKDINVITMKR